MNHTPLDTILQSLEVRTKDEVVGRAVGFDVTTGDYCIQLFTGIYVWVKLSDIVTCDGRPLPTAAATKCECGSFKVLGISKGAPGHSSWCPWVGV